MLRDSRDRIWITVSTMINPWSDAINSTLADGSIVLFDEKGARVVADGFRFTNEIRLDAREEWLYVAETTGKRVTRLSIRPDGSLTDREVFGPLHSGLRCDRWHYVRCLRQSLGDHDLFRPAGGDHAGRRSARAAR